MLRRFGYFFLTNLLVLVTISIMMSLLGVRGYMDANGINYQDLLIWCFIWGMAGSFVSLQMSRWSAKKMMGIQLIDPQSPGQFSWLTQKVEECSKAANLPKLPEIGIYESPEINAFATGPSKSRSLVAFSTGIINSMNKDELEGVIAHEIAHIQNGDMVTMTLIQGVMNAFVLFFSRIISFAVANLFDENKRAIVQLISTIVFDILLSILAHFVVNFFSRKREYRADAGAAALVGREKMIAALEHLKRRFEPMEDVKSLATMKIAGAGDSFWSTHPSLDNRIGALKNSYR